MNPPPDTKATSRTSGSRLIFEQSRPGRRGYRLPELDVPETDLDATIPAALRRDEVADECEVSEVDV
ncbi:MAG: hypothetical protein LC732_02855, partial [Acidobacteria bacterium]|nr:hypothetical protein [Acidobacteriota bacterium]